MFTQKIKTWFLLILLTFGVSGIAVWADELDGLSDGEVTFAAKRATVSKAISLEKAEGQVPEGLSQAEVNFFSYDSNEGKVKVLFNLNEVTPGSEKYAINVQSHSDDDLYFYAFKADRRNKVKKLFPSSGESSKNPVEGYMEAFASAGSNNWNAYDSKQGVEKFYLFLSQKPIKTLNGTPSKKSLDKMVKKYGKKTNYYALIDEEKEIAGDSSKMGKPIRVWFKGVYADKLVLINRGDSHTASKKLIRQAKKEAIKTRSKSLK